MVINGCWTIDQIPSPGLRLLDANNSKSQVRNFRARLHDGRSKEWSSSALEVTCSMFSHIDVSVSIWSRFHFDRWIPSNGWIFEGNYSSLKWANQIIEICSGRRYLGMKPLVHLLAGILHMIVSSSSPRWWRSVHSWDHVQQVWLARRPCDIKNSDNMLGPMASYIGRKTSLIIAILLIYVANIVMMTTDTIGGLYAGRLVIGLGNGFLMTFSQLYLQVSWSLKIWGRDAYNIMVE